MTRVSLQYGAVNLSQGFPDFDPPRQITDALAKAAHSGPHQYAITWGAQNFREALACKQSRFKGMPVHHLIRMHFAKREATLAEALSRMERMKTGMRR